MATDLISLNRVQYGGLDFDTIEDDLRAQMQVKFAASFNDFSVSSLGIVLLDVVSFGLDTLSFYLDRRATDTYLATARTRRAVALLTRQLGYKMGGSVSASCDLNVATKTAYAFPVPVPKGFQWQGPTGIVFESAQAVTIPASSTASVKIPVYQGTTVTETFVSNGTANQVFKLTRVPSGSAMVQGTVTVLVNGSPFTESDFVSFDATDQFEVNYNEDPPTLRFGDGVAGNIPIKNGNINVTYVAGLGSAGQALSHTIVKEVSPLVVMFQQISLVVDNPSNTVGGSDPEDLDHAKTYAPRVFKSRNVAVTKQDYEALAGSFADPLFGRVAVAQAISARSAANDLELQNLIVDINTSLQTAVAAIQGALTAFEFLNASARGLGVVANPSSYTILATDVGKIGRQLDDNTHWMLTGFGPLTWESVANVTSTSGAFLLTTGIGTANTQIQTDLTNLLVKLNTVNTNLTSILTTSRTIKSNVTELQLDQTDAAAAILLAQNQLQTVTTLINGYSIGAVSQLTSADQAVLLTTLNSATSASVGSYLTTIDTLLSLIGSLAASISASADSQTTVTLANQSILVNDVGLTVSTPLSIAKDMQTQINTISSGVGTDVSPYSGLFLALRTILSNASLSESTVASDTQSIQDHVDSILSADCKANLVVVPILARDASGFYAAPSIGLVKTLQSYLDGRKEVTQTVSVTSGVGFLVPAAIRVRLSVKLGVSEQVTQSSAISVIDGVLRDRAFGASLYVSELVTPLKAVPGVAFVNVTIVGYRPSGSLVILNDKLDAEGNLIIPDSEVITLSQSDLVVLAEVFTGSFS